MLRWDELREDGPAGLTPMRNELVSGLLLLWAGGVASALIFSPHAVTVLRIVRMVGLTGIPVAIGIWYDFQLVKAVWARNEREYALYLVQAKALPAPGGQPDAGAAV